MVIDNETLREQIEYATQGLASVRSFIADTELMEWFADDFALRFCWSSNAIEGSTLTLDETIALVEFDEVSTGHTYSEYRDAKNLYRAIRESMIPFAEKPITEAWIKKNSDILLASGGEYRNKNVKVGTLLETAHIPPSYAHIPEKMREYIETVNFKTNDIGELFEQITLSHLAFERIHPFIDGNGRVGRMVLNQQLINNGVLPVALTKNSAYIQGFRQYGKNGDYSKLMYEIVKSELESIERLISYADKREYR